VPSLSLPWYYLAIGGGVVLAIASGIARRWAILLIAIGLIALGYWFMTGGLL
jgi:hypothetical protein